MPSSDRRSSQSRPRIPAFFRAAGLGALLFAGLAGCGLFSSPAEQFDCPATAAVADATTLSKFLDGPGRDLTDVRYQVRLVDVLNKCSYDRTGVTVEMLVAFALELGPANPDRNASFPFFVAITDPSNEIIAKRIFTSSLAFPSNVGYVEHREELRQRIPLPKGGGASDYQVIVGLQLTEDELEYNRKYERR